MSSFNSIFGGDFIASNYKKQDGFITNQDPQIAFIDEMRNAGFKIIGRLSVGKITRVMAPDDKPHKQSGWYVYNEITDSKTGQTIGIGVYGSWRGNPDRVEWCSKSAQYMTDSERDRFNEQRAFAAAEHAAELAERQSAAAERANEIWSTAKPAMAHGYAVKKGVAPDGLKVDIEGALVIPVTLDGKIISLQFIDPSGKKLFLSGGRKKGGYYKIDGDDTAVVCEGWATGATIHAETGHTVYVAFDAGNLMDVTTFAKSAHKSVIVAGDNDHKTDGNPGKTKAEAAAMLNHCDLVLPPALDGVTDFNDWKAQGGNVKAAFKPNKVEKAGKNPKGEINGPTGFLADVEAYYNVTARAQQPMFAVQTALALASIVLGRAYRTNKGNHTSLYFLNVAKSGTGKEHAKTVIEEILNAAEIGNLIGGHGYTSSGAVFSTLLRSPRHITIIDEFGRYLEASKSNKNSNLTEANTQLMEAIGRCHGIARPPSYSVMTLPKEKQDELANRKILNPAITLVAMTTPVSLFANITSTSVSDGFLNRFIIAISDAERKLREHKDRIDVPEKILAWIRAVNERAYSKLGVAESADIAPNFQDLVFTDAAMAEQRKFEQYCIDTANKWESMNLAEMSGRSAEMAMRISLICAMSDNPAATHIEQPHMEWACNYVKFHLENTLNTLKMSVSNSEYEGAKKEVLKAIREAAGGVTWANMIKRPPFSKHKQKDLREILNALMDAGLITDEIEEREGRGRPSTIYKATED